MSPVRWGIIGPGSIAHNFADALKESFSGKLQAIASLNNERREEFGNKYNIENQFRFKTYGELLNSNDIDAVYISTPHTLHAELSIQAAGKGKHVLCEKPGAVNFKQGAKVIKAVQEAGVFYKEGFMYRCHPQIPALLELLKNKTIGDALDIMEKFSISGFPVVNKNNKVVGIITNRDVRFAQNMSQPISELMTKTNLITAEEGISRKKALDILHNNKINT